LNMAGIIKRISCQTLVTSGLTHTKLVSVSTTRTACRDFDSGKKIGIPRDLNKKKAPQ
jgi:hypothetical protein